MNRGTRIRSGSAQGFVRTISLNPKARRNFVLGEGASRCRRVGAVHRIKSRWSGWLPLSASRCAKVWFVIKNHEQQEPSTMKISTVGLDLAKNVFQVHGIDAAGEIVVAKALRRRQMIPFFGKLEPCLVDLETCATSHFWARQLIALGHEVKLMPHHCVGILSFKVTHKPTLREGPTWGSPVNARPPGRGGFFDYCQCVRHQLRRNCIATGTLRPVPSPTARTTTVMR